MYSGGKFALVTVSSLMFGTIAAIATVASASPADVTTSATILAQASQQQEPTEQVVEENDFKFQLQSCQRAGEKVTCSLLITNLAEEDREVTLYANNTSYNGTTSRSFDFSGNQYSSKTVQIGGDQSRQGDLVSTKLIKSVPIKANVSFELPQQVTQLAAIEIAYYVTHSFQDTKVVFRNVGIILSN